MRQCNCSGRCCGPQTDEVNRRDFLSIVGARGHHRDLERAGLGRRAPGASPARGTRPLEEGPVGAGGPAALPLGRPPRRPDAPGRHRHRQFRDRLRRPLHHLATLQHAPRRRGAAPVCHQGRRNGPAAANLLAWHYPNKYSPLAENNYGVKPTWIGCHYATLWRRRGGRCPRGCPPTAGDPPPTTASQRCPPTGEHPFVNGHASCILKAYREALNHPDDSFLKEYWPHVRRAVEYLIGRDAGKSGTPDNVAGTLRVPDGVLEDDQHNTYDQALHGVTTFMSGYYLAALRAGEEWATAPGRRQGGRPLPRHLRQGAGEPRPPLLERGILPAGPARLPGPLDQGRVGQSPHR